MTIGVPNLLRREDTRTEVSIGQYTNEGSGHCYRAGLIPYSVTLGQCSCDLISTAVDDAEDEVKKIRSKYEARGWSKSKIERALSGHKKAKTERPRINSILKEFLVSQIQKQEELELILHWHSGSFASEAFDILETIEITSVEGLGVNALREDVRYIFRNSNG
jgi:hypothetical protein